MTNSVDPDQTVSSKTVDLDSQGFQGSLIIIKAFVCLTNSVAPTKEPFGSCLFNTCSYVSVKRLS